MNSPAQRRLRAPPEHVVAAGVALGAVVSLWCFRSALLWVARVVIAVAALLWAAFLMLERGLGWLAGWGISKTPKRFRWTIERICVRPSLSWSSSAWSEVSIYNWTWHNPPDFFVTARTRPAEDYLLEIDRLTLRLELSSIYRAVRQRKAIQVDQLLLEGVRFRTTRNREAALNLWEVLELPDDDVNIHTIVATARDLGGMGVLEARSANRDAAQAPAMQADGGAVRQIQALPAIATPATRKAANFWRPSWVRPEVERKFARKMGGRCPGCFAQLPGLLCSWKSATNPSRCQGDSAAGDEEEGTPSLPVDYIEFPIGDSRRRPRWGVPVRLDIRNVVVLRLELWILDLLIMDSHRTVATMDPATTRMHVASLALPRERLEAGDPRRCGEGLREGWPGDGVHGLYLGELIWVLIAEVVPLIAKKHPGQLMKNALFAAGFGVKDVARRFGAGVLEMAKNPTRECVCEEDHPDLQNACRLQVRLIRGRRMTRDNKRVNVSAHLELCAPPRRRPGRIERTRTTRFEATYDRTNSPIRFWTKAPKWDAQFFLGPVRSTSWFLRITCIDDGVGEFGSVSIPLSSLRISHQSIDRQGELVGWFTLEPSENVTSTGQLKLGLRLLGTHHLSLGTLTPHATTV